MPYFSDFENNIKQKEHLNQVLGYHLVSLSLALCCCHLSFLPKKSALTCSAEHILKGYLFKKSSQVRRHVTGTKSKYSSFYDAGCRRAGRYCGRCIQIFSKLLTSLKSAHPAKSWFWSSWPDICFINISSMELQMFSCKRNT